MANFVLGKTALITGASAGIGAEFARQLHLAGADVILVARRKEKLQVFCDSLNAIRPNSAKAIVADLTQDQSSNSETFGLKELCHFIESTPIDILINNAGIGSFGYFDVLPLDRELEMIKLNIVATTVLAHSCIAGMKKRKTGAIINLSSIAGFQPLPYMSTYAATKVFNLFQARALRQELNDFNIRVLAVCPGPTETEFFGVARVPGTMTGTRRDDVKDVVSESLLALEKDKAVAVTCFRSKLMAFGSRLVPTALSTWFVKRTLTPLIKSIK